MSAGRRTTIVSATSPTIVADVVPGCRLEIAPDASPDTRSYRVSFEKIARVLPAFKPQFDARRGAEQLYAAYRRSALTLEEFEGPRYQRIGHIQKLIADGILAGDLRHCATTDPGSRARLRAGKQLGDVMIFTETKLKGAFIIDLERREDERGFFARAFCQNEFSAHGLKPVIAQANIAFNPGRARCAACTSSIRRRPRPSWCGARAAPSSTSSSTCVRKARPISSTSPSSSTKTT